MNSYTGTPPARTMRREAPTARVTAILVNPLVDDFVLAVDELLGESNPSMEKVDLEQLILSEPFLEYRKLAPTTNTKAMVTMCNKTNQERSKMAHPLKKVHSSMQTAPEGFVLSPGDRSTNQEEIPKKPKRALSAYNMFFQSERKRILNSLPKTTKAPAGMNKRGRRFTDMTRVLAATWKKISKEERMEYDYRAAMDGERYEREMEQWKRGNKKARAGVL